MAENKDSKGYSNALGGYGVPAQVELTAASSAVGKSTSGSFPAFKLNKKNIIIIAAAAVVVVALILALTGVFSLDSKYASSISSIEKYTQNNNGAQVTNYIPLLAKDVDWAKIDEKEREGIAKYAVKKALDQAATDQAGIYNIMGMTNGQEVSIFLYSVKDEKQKVMIMVDYKVTGEITL